jgi:His-Xaa-Ser system radical SAM maturase HxsB
VRHNPIALPYATRQLPSGLELAIAQTGDHAFLSTAEVRLLAANPAALPLTRQAELQARFLLSSGLPRHGTDWLARSRIAAKRETVLRGPSLHIIVPTLQCAHSCRYCQVSRALDDSGHSMAEVDLDAACDSIFESSCEELTVEFQGGDPLLRYDLVERAVQRISAVNQRNGRRIRFVVASTLHQLDDRMCVFFKEHGVLLSTSVDGPSSLHNRNRPLATRDAYERTIAGIERARQALGHEAVSALMTTTRESLMYAQSIVDEYVSLGLRDIFIRPLSPYGFAKRNQLHLAYSLEAFKNFYREALERVLYWNRQGIEVREVYASVILNKILSTFDGGYVDLQSPTGAGNCVLVYNYDGYVYPSDEARMLAETGDTSLRLGRIGTPMRDLLGSTTQRELNAASDTDEIAGCKECAYRLFCAPNPVDARAQHGSAFAPVLQTDHCQRHMWLFDTFFELLRTADDWTLDLFHRWARPPGSTAPSCVA